MLEYSKIHRKAIGSLWNYYREESSNPLSSNSKSFKYKASITENIYNLGAGDVDYDLIKLGKNETEAVILTWSKSCVLADVTVRAAENNNDPPAIVAPTGLELQITDTNCMF